MLAQDTLGIEIANPGFEGSPTDGTPTGWYGNLSAPGDAGPGYAGSLDPEGAATGATSLKVESLGQPGAREYGTISQALAATRLRGRRIRVTAKVRVSEAPPDHAGLWLRVERQIGLPVYLDNMADRPITSNAWQAYAVEADIPHDATAIYFGFSIGGTGAAWIDDVAIENIGAVASQLLEDPDPRPGPPRSGPVEGDVAPAPISERGALNLQAFARLYGLVRWFHPSRQALETDWTRFLIAHLPAVEAAGNPAQLAEVMREAFAPIAPSLAIAPGNTVAATEVPKSAQHIRWKYNGYASLPNSTYSGLTEAIPASEAPQAWSEELPGGIAVSLPLSVPIDARRRTLPLADESVPPDLGKPEGWIPAGFDRTTRIAGIVSAWAALDHFYPYWDVVDTDWDATFAPVVREAALAQDDIVYRNVLRSLIERLQDGHGNVFYRYDAAYILPLDWAWIDGRLVVTASSPDAGSIRPGMIVRAIDGRPAALAMEDAMSQISGSIHSKRYRAAMLLRGSHEVGQRTLTLEQADGTIAEVEIPLHRATRESWFLEKRPTKLAELGPGLVYADLTRIEQGDLAAAMEKFASAEAIVLDVRGYPRARSSYLAHMTDNAIRSAAMRIAIQTRPDAQFDSFRDVGWTIEPERPRYTDKIVWITDGSAGSYPESILGTVKANGLGTIVGSPTAGANGDYTRFRLPGGYQIQWTGLQVVNRDGSQHHNIGVLPDIEVRRTLSGVREGRDELLEAALEVVREQLSDR